ncbi:putative restriction endonuclease [Mucilaginibacter sp. UYNi724]
MPNLNDYLPKLTHLKRGITKYGLAPHKPILLITLLELIDKGHITDNRVFVDTDLVGIFQENWRLLISTLHQPDFTQPFFYLQSENVGNKPIWQLMAKPGCQINAHIKSVNTLIQVLEYGHFDPELFQLLAEPTARQSILLALLSTYFPETQQAYFNNKRSGRGYYHDLQDYVLNEPEAQYKTVRIETEEDVFVRGGLFKKLIPKVYNNTCCITGMRLESTFGHNFIDACHITPFSVTHDDKVSNGLALCPNLHRAFDRGLITVDSNYFVITSRHISEDVIHTYSLNQLKGKKLILPSVPQYRPALENLEWHRDQIFKD